MKKGDKGMKIWGLIVILMFVMSCFSWAAGSEGPGSYKIHAYSEQDGSLFDTTKPDEVANKSICSVTLITGDVVIVSTLPDGKRGFAIKSADPTKLGQNFQIFETPKGTYIFPEGIDLSKLDKELFNIDYLIREGYCNLTYLPVLVDYKDKEEKRLGAAALKELEKEVNITIVKSYRSIPTFSAKLSFVGIDKTFKTLIQKPEIKKIWLDKKIKASLYESVPLIGAPDLWKSGYNGSGLEIAILDTGIDDTHPDLDDMDDNPATDDPKVIRKKDFTDDNTTEDLYGHGTHCAGIAAGTGNASSTAVYPLTHETKAPQSSAEQGNALMGISPTAENGDNVFREPEPGENRLREFANEDIRESDYKDRHDQEPGTRIDDTQPCESVATEYIVTSEISNHGGVMKPDLPGDGPPENITRPSARVALASENVKKFRTDTAPELDWYQPCNGGDNLIDFNINVTDIDVSEIKSATLTLSVWDVDIPGIPSCGPEIDQVYFNGHYLGTLTGANNQWSTCTFTVNPSYIVEGANSVKIYIDTTGSGCWCVECDWGELTVTLAKAPEIEKIIITPKDPMTRHAVTFEAKITDAPGFEIRGVDWIITDLASGRIDFFDIGKKNPYTHKPAAGTHGKKEVLCTIFYKNKATGATGLDQESKGFKLFFEKGSFPNWADDGKPGADGKPAPNWFKYWKKDVAVPKMDNAEYNPNKSGYGYAIGNQAYLCKKAAGQHYHSAIELNTYFGAERFGGPSVKGIDCAAEVIAHELYHVWVTDQWKSGGSFHNKTDSDKNLPNYNDRLPDFYENTTSHTLINDTDTYDLEHKKHPTYRRYGDEEYMAMRIGNTGRGDKSKDWANPGKQTTLVVYSPSEFYALTSLHVEQTVSQTEFTGNYSDHGSDTNGNSLYDYLTVTVDVNITNTGYYDIVGWLNDSNGNEVDLVNNEYFLESGISSVELNFDGLNINHHGVNGPYSLSLILSDEYGNEIDSQYDVYDTSPYSYTDFEGQQIWFTSSYSDYGTDTDSDGVYDYLTVEVETSTTIAENYTIEGYLYGDETAIVFTSNSTYFGIGTQTTVLNFDGLSIAQSKMDGPYTLSYLTLYDENDTQIDFIYDAYNTSAYSYTDFQSPTASFRDTYSDYGLDTNGDGFYEYLTVEVGLNVITAGNYSIQGRLYDSYGNKTAETYNLTYLNAGNQTATLNFDGLSIYRHEIDGPYNLSYLLLYDEKGILVDSRYEAYRTSVYSYNDFQRPLVELTGNYSDYGTDTDSDGLYTYLTVDVGVIVKNAGNYDINARLMDERGKEIIWAADTSYLYANQAQTIQLNFDGKYIYGNMMNGSFYLKDVHVYNKADLTQSDYVYDAYTTSAYNYTDFQKSGVITGTVKDVNETPVSNAAVFVSGVDYDTTDADGNYILIIPQTGTYTIKVDPPYHANLFGDSANVYVAFGEIVVHNFTLKPSGTITGVVKDYNETPVYNARVSVSGPSSGYAYTDVNGKYMIVRLKTGTYTVTASPPSGINLVPNSTTASIIAGETTIVNLTLQKGGIITGNITDYNGIPVYNAYVRASGPSYGYDYTDVNGTYTIDRLKTGTYTVTASPPSGINLVPNSTTASIIAGETTIVNLTLQKGGIITGNITDYNGIPVYNAYVRASGPSYGYDYTDVNGTYTIDRLKTGTYTVTASPPSGINLVPNSTTASVIAGETTIVDLVLQKPPALFNDVYSDCGEDTDNDGLHNYLVIDVGVNVTKAGRYQVSGYLYENATYSSVAYVSNTSYLQEGDQTVKLRFDGITMWQNKYDGRYDLRYLYLYNRTTYPYSHALDLEQKIARGEISPENVSVLYGERFDYRYYAYTTSYYNHSEFQRPPALFNDVYSDSGEDTDNDGLHNYLVIDVGVNVTKAGRYQVSGSLYENATYSSVAYAYNTTYLQEGDQTVKLRFDGITIRQNKYDGRYDLKSLYLYNMTYSSSHALDLDLEQKIARGEISPENVSVLYGERLDYRYYAYTTGYYEWTEFQRPPAEFNDVYVDHGEDTDTDGLYNYLVIEVGVNVTKEGRYKVEGSLYDTQGNYIEWKSNSKYLSPGNQTIKLKFDGIKIRKNGVSGTFDLRYLYLYDASWKRLDYKYYAYTTAYYNYTDFQEFPRYIGVAPGAELWNVKVLNKYGSGYMSWIIDGIEYAAYGPDGIADTEDEADIISMSLGGAPTDGTDPLSRAVNNAVDSGVVVAVAAGNAWDYFTIGTPGAAEKVITVGASTKYDELAWFSSKGPTLDLRVKPDVVAPGVSIVAPRANNTTMGYPYNDYYTSASGTSMSTPHVAGAAALILQVHPGWTPEEVKNILISTAEDLGYNVYQQGGGRIYVPYAADPKILVNPATISFKNLDTTSKAITFKNLDTVTHTLILNVTVREVFNDMQVDCAYLNRTSLNIAPGSSASVLLTIDTTSLPKSLYSGKVSATYSTSTGEVHSIFGFSTWNKVTVNKINMAGEPGDYDLVLIFADERYAWRELKMQDKWTDENGTAAFYLPDGTYNIISGWGDVKGASVYTVKENVTIESDMSIALDERTAKVIDFDYNKSGQIMSEKSDKVYYKGENVSVSFGSLRGYPNETRTFVTLTSFETIFIYCYYPEEYYNKSNRWLVNASEWHKLLYNLSSITENVTFSPDYGKLVERTTDYKVAMEPELAERVQFAWHPDMWSSGTFGYRMNPPLHRIEWLSPSPVSYSGWYEQYAEWWNATYPDWSYDISGRCYPAGLKPYFAIGEHPFKSGAKIDIWGNYLEIYGTISEDTFGNSFVNVSRLASYIFGNITYLSGNITVIADGEVIIDHEDIWDHFWESVYFYGTPKFKVIIQGNSSPRLSTYTRTELNFVADPAKDYQPPEVTMRVLGSDLYNKVPGGDAKVKMNIEDESNISDVTLEYSLDSGTTWNSASITYKGVTGCKPISGGSRTVVDKTYTFPKYSKVRIFMDDTEDKDEIHYNYIFTLKKSDGTEYTKSGSSSSTIGDVYDTLYYDEDNDGVLDLFKSIYIRTYTEDNDKLDVKVEGWDGALWKCLYGKKIKEYEADLGFVSDKYVSLRANATDSEGNSISQTVIKGFALKIAADMPDLSPVISVPSSAFIGDTVDINVTVYNHGTMDSNATTLDVCVNDVSIDTKSVPVINPGSHQVFTVPWTPSSIGVYTIKATVDPNNTNNESNEYNNIDIKQVSVVPKVVSPGYPSIMGTHTGNFTPDQDINVSRMYTYPCSGTGGHSKYAAFYYPNGTEIASGNWTGYQGNYHYIYFSEPFKLEEGITYRYKIITGSYPQIYHSQSVLIPEGTLTCTRFVDANGKEYTDWIPAIRLE